MMDMFRKLFGGPPPSPPKPQWPANVTPADQLARELYDSAALRCSLAVADPKLSGDFRSSWIGKVAAAAPGESWPELAGVPMIGVCQFNLAEAPIIPPELEGTAFVCVYMAREKKGDYIDFPFDTEEIHHRTNEFAYRDKLCVRSYPSVGGMVEATDPSPKPSPLKPCRLRFEEFIDHRTNLFGEIHEWLDRHSLPRSLDEIVGERIHELSEEMEEKPWGTKLGGWPAPIQSDIDDPLAFQIGCENAAGLQFVDGGCAYAWRNPGGDGPEWRMLIEFY